jgi:hypothetical protein
MSWSRICALTITITLMLCISALSYAVAGGENAAVGSDEIKVLLLRPNGWLAEWRGNTNTKVSEFMFEERGEKVVVKILIPSWNQSCEHDVKITSDVIKFDGCNDTGIRQA